MKIFSERLKALRKERGLTQKEMAELLRLKLRAYQYYESGDHEPSLDSLVTIANVLQTSTDFLTGRTDQR